MVTSVDGVLPEEEEVTHPKFSSQAGLGSWSGAQVPVSGNTGPRHLNDDDSDPDDSVLDPHNREGFFE